MKDELKKVEEFHKKFKQEIGFTLCNISREEATLRVKLMSEEMEEYLDAVLKYDTVEIADALGDQLYILLGTIVKHGMQHVIVDVFNEIHRSNMSKLGEDGEPILREDGKIMKGPNYKAPNITSVIIPF
jgi:predicted HAD superfamily Cof-like phosphohydrolase